MRVVDLVIVIGWLVFWAYWLISARNIKPGRDRGNWFTGIRVAVIILIVFLARSVGFGPHKAAENWALAGAGLAVWVLGLAFAVWARLYIGQNWGMPMTQAENPELVTTGPYHFVRHPIYTGLILGMVGTTLAITLFGLIAVLVLAGYFIYSAVSEERYLTKVFPDAYPEYKRRSKMLIPFVF